MFGTYDTMYFAEGSMVEFISSNKYKPCRVTSAVNFTSLPLVRIVV